MTKKSITAALESTFLHGSPFSADLLNNVLMNFIDELEESLHNDADDALICVVEDDHDVRRIGNPTSLERVWLTPSAAVNRRFWAGIRWDGATTKAFQHTPPAPHPPNQRRTQTVHNDQFRGMKKAPMISRKGLIRLEF